MRVLFVIDHFGPGGAQHQLVELAIGLTLREHEVHCFAYQSLDCGLSGRLEQAGVAVHRHLKTKRFSLGVVPALQRTILGLSPHVVLSFLRTPNLYSLLATRPLRCPLVVADRSTDLTPPPLLQRAILFSYRWSTRVVTNSHAQRQRLIASMRLRSESVSTIWNGVDLDRFKPRQKVDAERHDAPRLLSVGRVGPEKNSEGLARALVLCQARGQIVPTVTWAGQQDETPAGIRVRASTDEILRRSGLAARWRWIGLSADVPALLQMHDALVHPALSEGLPNAVCEALASGRPVLTGAIADGARLVQDGVTGALFDPADPESIADALHGFALSGTESWHSMGASAREFAERHLGMTRCLDQYEQLLLDVVAQQKPWPVRS